jgi:hypothetical protein
MISVVFFVLFGLSSSVQTPHRDLSFQKALELTRLHSEQLGSPNTSEDQLPDTCINFPDTSSVFVSGFARGQASSIVQEYSLAINELKSEAPMKSSADKKHASAELTACAVVNYVNLLKRDLQLRILDVQVVDAHHLIDAEVRRIRRQVDDSRSMNRARLYLARAEFWQAFVQDSVRTSRTQLSALTGVPDDQLGTIERALPATAFDERADEQYETELALWEKLRDVALLEYAVARDTRMRILVRGTIAKSTLPDLMSATLDERERALSLIEIHFDLLALRLLAASAENSRLNNLDLANDPRDASAKSLILAPLIDSLPIGQVRKLTLYEVLADNSNRDVTKRARWRCPDSVDTIVSSDGVIASFSKGPATIHAEIGKLNSALRVTVIADDLTSSDY